MPFADLEPARVALRGPGPRLDLRGGEGPSAGRRNGSKRLLHSGHITSVARLYYPDLAPAPAIAV